MIAYRAKELDITGFVRTHPWKTSDFDEACRYVDFIEHPEQIESSLEDFLPWKASSAAQGFYSLVRWLNGPESQFETNDCAFSLEDNPDTSKPYKLVASGRLMLFVSEMTLTCTPDFIEWLMAAFFFYLERIEPLEASAVGISKAPCFYKNVQRRADELVLYFWAWGDSEEKTLDTLEGVFERVHDVCKSVNTDVAETLERAMKASASVPRKNERSPNA